MTLVIGMRYGQWIYHSYYHSCRYEARTLSPHKLWSLVCSKRVTIYYQGYHCSKHQVQLCCQFVKSQHCHGSSTALKSTHRKPIWYLQGTSDQAHCCVRAMSSNWLVVRNWMTKSLQSYSDACKSFWAISWVLQAMLIPSSTKFSSRGSQLVTGWSRLLLTHPWAGMNLQT